MNKTLEIQNFFSHFDPKLKISTIEFCKSVSKTKADLFILMARKAACFFDCLHELGIIHFNGLVASDRILEMNCAWLRNKKIIIIDDAIISGTTIFEAIQKLEKFGVAEIQVFVLSINEKYFQPLLLENSEGKSYLQKPHQVLKDQECIKMCSDIINSLSKYVRPYSVDFPLYKNFYLSEIDFQNLLQTDVWEIDDISTGNQKLQNITVLTFSPKIQMLNLYDNLIGLDMSRISIAKVRLYVKRNDEKKTNEFYASILPVVVLKPIYEANIDKIFDHLTENKSQQFIRHFTSNLSKIHFIQFVCGGVFANIWNESIKFDIKTQNKLIPNDFNNSLLFNPFVSTLINNSVNYHYKKKHNSRKSIIQEVKVISDNKINEEIPNWPTTIDTFLGMQVALTQPFIDLYHNDELESRKLVLEFGKDVFNKEKFKEKTDRLKRGFSINYLLKILDSIILSPNDNTNKPIDKNKFVSLFLDKSIDLGVVVPIVAERKGNGGLYYYRAYRHGEDVIFGETEFLLCTLLLDSFIKASKRPDNSITHITAEKLIVLFIKIGIQKQIFTQFIGNLPSLNSLKIEGVASIRNYLFGQIATFKIYDRSKDINTPIYLNQETKSTWITEKLIKKHFLFKNSETNLYQIGDPDFGTLDQAKKLEAKILGSFFGEIMSSESKALLKEDDLVTLTSCLEFRDIAGSLAAEIVIFNTHWPDFISYFDNNKSNPYRYFLVASNMRANYNGLSFTAINSGQDKYCRFVDKKGIRLINEVEYRLNNSSPRDASTWLALWSPNLGTKEQEKSNNQVSDLIDEQGKWLLTVNLLYRSLEYALRKLSIIKKEVINPKNEQFLRAIANNYIKNLPKGYLQDRFENDIFFTDLQVDSKIPLTNPVTKLSDEELLDLLQKYNSKLIEKLESEITDYKIKLSKYNMSSDLKYNSFNPVNTNIKKLDKNDLRTLVWETVENIKNLNYKAELIITNVDKTVSYYGIPNVRVDYTSALFFDITEVESSIAIEFYNELKTFVRKNKEKLFNSVQPKKEVSCFFVDGRKTFTSRGIWLFTGEHTRDFGAFDAALRIWDNFSLKFKFQVYVFTNLRKEHAVSRTGNDSSDIHYNYFWTLAESFISGQLFILTGFHIKLITARQNYLVEIRSGEQTMNLISDNLKIKHSIDRYYSEMPFPHEAIVVQCNIEQNSAGKLINKKTQRKRVKESATPNSNKDLFTETMPKFDIGIIAIKDTELSALLKGLDDVIDDVPGESKKKYYGAKLQGKNTVHKVVFCKQPDMGNLDSSSMYNLMKKDFNPPLIIIFGTAGGYQDKINLCDVLIPTKVIYYELGKETKNGFQHEVLYYRLNELFRDHFITDFFARNGGDEVKLESTAGSYLETFNLRQGVIGCGDKILTDPDSEIRAWLRGVDRKSTIFEMESVGAMAAHDFNIVFNKEKSLGVLPIRAITDFGNLNKTSEEVEKYRSPALQNAILFMKKLFLTIPDLNKFLEKIHSDRRA